MLDRSEKTSVLLLELSDAAVRGRSEHVVRTSGKRLDQKGRTGVVISGASVSSSFGIRTRVLETYPAGPSLSMARHHTRHGSAEHLMLRLVSGAVGVGSPHQTVVIDAHHDVVERPRRLYRPSHPRVGKTRRARKTLTQEGKAASAQAMHSVGPRKRCTSPRRRAGWGGKGEISRGTE